MSQRHLCRLNPHWNDEGGSCSWQKRKSPVERNDPSESALLSFPWTNGIENTKRTSDLSLVFQHIRRLPHQHEFPWFSISQLMSQPAAFSKTWTCPTWKPTHGTHSQIKRKLVISRTNFHLWSWSQQISPKVVSGKINRLSKAIPVGVFPLGSSWKSYNCFVSFLRCFLRSRKNPKVGSKVKF